MTTNPLDIVNDNLKLMLQGLVPLAIFELDGTTFEQRQQMGADASQIICEAADQLMFGGRRGPEALNAIVKALAILAYQPGGVDFSGLHFCTDHQACIQAEISARETKTDGRQRLPDLDPHSERKLLHQRWLSSQRVP